MTPGGRVDVLETEMGLCHGWYCAQHGSVAGVAATASAGGRGGLHRRIAVHAGGQQPFFVALPQVGLLSAQLVQVVPAEDAGVGRR